MTTVTKKPDGKCYACNFEKWWTPDGGGRWLCGVCHPDSAPELHPQPPEISAEKQLSPEVEALRQRVANGNTKLINAWMEYKKITEEEESKRQFRLWGEAVDRLTGLCCELQRAGFMGCLYGVHKCFDWPDGMCCLACSETGDPMWDLLARDMGERRPVAKQETVITAETIQQVKTAKSENAELKIFLETLGGRI